MIDTPCKNWNWQDWTCSKGTDCECVTGQDDHVYDARKDDDMTDEKASDLLPCPCCESTDLQVRRVSGHDLGFVKCLNCLIQGTVAAWNTRPTLPDEAELVEILKPILAKQGNMLNHPAYHIIDALRPFLSDGEDKARIAELEVKLTQAYRERNIAAAHFAHAMWRPPERLAQVGMRKDDRGNDFWPVLMVDYPPLQISWHIPPSDMDLMAGFPSIAPHRKWDGTYESKTGEKLLNALKVKDSK